MAQPGALKLLIVIPYFPPHIGGTELFAANIADELTHYHAWNVVVVTTSDKAHEEIEQRSDGLRIYRLPYKAKISNTPLSLAWLWRIRRIIRNERPDLVNVHTPVPGLADIASLLAGKRPVVVNYHAGSMRKERSRLNLLIWLYESFLLQPMLCKARKIISSSDYVRDSMLEKFKDKTVTISPAVDSDMFHPAESRSDSHRVVFVGSLKKSDGHKNLDGLLLACELLRQEIADLTITVVGDGDGRAVYEELARDLRLADITTFTGWLERAELACTYREGAVFALASRQDSFPLVITEAMASGLPVVTTRVGGIPTLVEDGVDGLLVPPDDLGALVDALRRVLMDQDLACRLGRAGREKAVRSLNWSSRGELTNRVLRDVLS